MAQNIGIADLRNALERGKIEQSEINFHSSSLKRYCTPQITSFVSSTSSTSYYLSATVPTSPRELLYPRLKPAALRSP